MSQNLSEGSVPASLEAITQAVLSFVNADNWGESKHIVTGRQSL